MEDTGNPDPGSLKKTVENYKAQYEALKEKLNSFPQTKFILWTAAANEKSNASEADADAKICFRSLPDTRRRSYRTIGS